MTAATLTITDFLLARIAEDEAMAREAGGGSWYSYYRGVHLLQGVEPNDPDFDPESDVFDAATKGHARHIVRHDPARVLAECEAKRQIVAECRALINSFGDWDAEVGAPAMWTDVNRRERSQAHGRLYTLAAIYADHPDYREEWKP